MAGDWIKMSTGLRTHPKVVRMASALKADRLRVIGGLWAVWSVFDAHSTDGLLEGYTPAVMDEELNWKGFTMAMQGIGWLEVTDEGLIVPRFDEHNSASAKRRAMETERKRSSREADKTQTGGGQMSASDADKNGTREEKRREEEKYPPTPLDEIVELYHAKLPELPQVRLRTDARVKATRSFWRWVLTSKRSDGTPRAETAEQGLAWIGGYFERAASNDFLMGRSNRPGAHANWRADFDFLLTEKGRKHVIERTVDA